MTKLDVFNTSFLNDFTKGAVGFDDIFTKMTDFQKNIHTKISTYPFYNIKKTGENTYVIEMAVAGFSKQDIELTLEDGVLTIKGSVTSDDTCEYIFKGIADRAFTRKFTLADTVEVKNADLINGMLKIFLERFIPESKKPKKIEINTDSKLSNFDQDALEKDRLENLNL
jgi:molecular chaperone IbpA